MWSLGVEEQFYFCFPLLLALCFGTRVAARPWLTLPRCVPPVVLLLASGVGSLAFSSMLTRSNQPWAFYLLPSRFWQLMAGAVLYVSQEPTPREQIARSIEAAPREGDGSECRETLKICLITVCESAVVALVAVALTCTPGDHDFPMPWALPATFAALGYVALGSRKFVKPRRWGRIVKVPSPLLNAALSSRLPVYIGKLSYPLYLWHWPAFVTCRWMGVLQVPGVQVRVPLMLI